jgi:hypothetical protein
VGPLAAGSLYGLGGPAAPFISGGVLSLAAALVAFFMLRSVRSKKQELVYADSEANPKEEEAIAIVEQGLYTCLSHVYTCYQ